MTNSKLKGISTLEVVISLSILSVVSVASVWLVFTTLALRDQVLSTTSTVESLRIFSRSLARAVAVASSVSSDSNSLLVTSPTECWSFRFDSIDRTVYYSEVLASGCVPVLYPSKNFFPSYSEIDNLVFQTSTLPTGGRQVRVSGTINTILPFGSYLSNFSESFTNLVD